MGYPGQYPRIGLFHRMKHPTDLVASAFFRKRKARTVLAIR